MSCRLLIFSGLNSIRRTKNVFMSRLSVAAFGEDRPSRLRPRWVAEERGRKEITITIKIKKGTLGNAQAVEEGGEVCCCVVGEHGVAVAERQSL